MRIRTGWCLLICAAVLTACTASGPKGPAATVTTPAVGRPPAPASVAAAMASEAFTPYAALGAATNDGLAPGDTYDALHTACMEDAGYGQYASEANYMTRRRWDYFVKNLLGAEPPKEYELGPKPQGRTTP